MNFFSTFEKDLTQGTTFCCFSEIFLPFDSFAPFGTLYSVPMINREFSILISWFHQLWSLTYSKYYLFFFRPGLELLQWSAEGFVDEILFTAHEFCLSSFWVQQYSNALKYDKLQARPDIMVVIVVLHVLGFLSPKSIFWRDVKFGIACGKS